MEENKDSPDSPEVGVRNLKYRYVAVTVAIVDFVYNSAAIIALVVLTAIGYFHPIFSAILGLISLLQFIAAIVLLKAAAASVRLRSLHDKII